MAIHVRESGMRLVLGNLLAVALVSAFLMIQAFVFHSLGGSGAAITSVDHHALALSPKPHCSGTPAPC